jgi:hypothetical protein
MRVQESQVSCGRNVEEMKEKMEGLASKQDVKALMVQMFEKLRFLENTVQISSAINYASNVLIEDILVAGGLDSGLRFEIC